MSFRSVWYTARVDRVVGAAGDRGLNNAGDRLLEESNKAVPLLTGELLESGEVSGDDGEFAVSYTSPYAVIQHEDVTYRHSAGRHAKFLEQALDTEQPALLGDVAESLREVMPPVHLP